MSIPSSISQLRTVYRKGDLRKGYVALLRKFRVIKSTYRQLMKR